MSGHDLIDDYLSELMDDPGKGKPVSASKPSSEQGSRAKEEASAKPTAPADAPPASEPPGDDPLAAFREGDPNITDDEFEAMLDALHGTPGDPAQPASAQPAASEDPLAAFRAGGDEISEDEFEAMLDALQGQPAGPRPATQDPTAPAAVASGDPLAAFREGGEEISEDEFEAMLDALQGAEPSPAPAPAPSRTAAAPAPPPAAAPALPSRAIQALLPPSEPAPAHGEPALPPERRRRAEDRVSSWLRFNLARQCFAVEVLKVQEVLRVPQILPVRGTDEATLGVMNLRGQIVPVMDLAVRLGFSPTEPNEASRVVVLEEKGETLGLLVASVADVLNLSEGRMERISGTPSLVAADVVRGVSRRDGQIVIMLDASRLLA